VTGRKGAQAQQGPAGQEVEEWNQVKEHMSYLAWSYQLVTHAASSPCATCSLIVLCRQCCISLLRDLQSSTPEQCMLLDGLHCCHCSCNSCLFAVHAMLGNCPKQDLILAKYSTFICVFCIYILPVNNVEDFSWPNIVLLWDHNLEANCRLLIVVYLLGNTSTIKLHRCNVGT